jgi:TIR domain
MTNPSPTSLFISYANEDLPLARWLAGKLAARGHAVWFDKMKPLANEPWPETADETIKSRTFRMISLMSEHSWRKKKPALERMLAQRVIRQQGIPDFLIPLKLDDSKPDELTDMTSAISFENEWIDGWKKLIKRLDSVKAPRSLQNGIQLVSSTFAPSKDLIDGTGERLFANLVRVKSFPNALRVYQAADDMSPDEWQSLESAWTFYAITGDALVALIPPPPEFSDRIRPTREQLHWADRGAFRNIQYRKLAAAVILKALARRLIKAGCSRHPDPQFNETFFLPEAFAEGGQLSFNNFEGKQITMPIRGKVSFRRTGGITELDFHHFAFRLRVARGLDNLFYIQLTPSLVFFDAHGRTLSEKSALSRLRRVRKTWNNEEWLNRVLAAEQVLNSSLPAGVNDPTLEPGLVRLDSSARLEEGILESDAAKKKAELEEELDLEEPEMEEADE